MNNPVRLFSRTLIGLIAGLILMVAAHANPGLRHALIIANHTYPAAQSGINLFGPLQAPPRDATLMADLMRELGFALPAHNILRNASRRDIDTAVKRFVRQLPQDAVTWIYYSGHGIEVAGKNYLIPADQPFGSAADILHEAVNANWVLGKMTEAIPQGVGLLTLDACRDTLTLQAFKGIKINRACLKSLSNFTVYLLYYIRLLK